jgi:hypothetical protein
MTTILETRKTAMTTTTTTTQDDGKGQLFMLGCFAPHDDIELGITKFRASPLPPVTEDLKHVLLSHYSDL